MTSAEISECIVHLTLAKADIEFAIAKMCQAKVACEMGIDRSRDGEVFLAMEAVDRTCDSIKAARLACADDTDEDV